MFTNPNAASNTLCPMRATVPIIANLLKVRIDLVSETDCVEAEV